MSSIVERRTITGMDTGDLIITDSAGRKATLHWSRFHGLIVSVWDPKQGAVYLGDSPELKQWLDERLSATTKESN